MFTEPSITGERRGWIEVICGSMFSGKTEELIRRLKRAKIANLKVKIYKPAIDVRYDEAIAAGLDMDFQGKPFGPVPQLLAKADYITKLHAICVKCGSIASNSFRKTTDDAQVLLGEKDVYEPRCRKCYYEK